MLKPMLAALAAASFLTLGACTQETRVEDQTPATTEQALENAGDNIEQAGQDAANNIEQAGDHAADSINDATDGNPNTNVRRHRGEDNEVTAEAAAAAACWVWSLAPKARTKKPAKPLTPRTNNPPPARPIWAKARRKKLASA